MNHLGRPLKIYEVNPIGRAETFNIRVKFFEEESTTSAQEVAN